jgi:hypothetical protein
LHKYTFEQRPSASNNHSLGVLKVVVVFDHNYKFQIFKQQFISSVFWNRYMQQYHTLLELPHLSVDSHLGMGDVQKFQTDTLQSAPFWIIVWSWRLLNPHAQVRSTLTISWLGVS